MLLGNNDSIKMLLNVYIVWDIEFINLFYYFNFYNIILC